jgi:hypothetical protein
MEYLPQVFRENSIPILVYFILVFIYGFIFNYNNHICGKTTILKDTHVPPAGRIHSSAMIHGMSFMHESEMALGILPLDRLTAVH